MAERRLTLETAGDVATLYLDAPPRNEMDREFFDDLRALVRETLPGLDVEGLIVRGRGRHFSAGANVAELRARVAASPSVLPGELAENAICLAELERLPYPVVAAIDGCCLGSGLELALACSARVATPRALLALPELSFGIMPGWGGTVRLTELAGPGPAIDLILTGRYLSGAEARDLGVVDAVVASPELGTAAARLVRRLGRRAARAGA